MFAFKNISFKPGISLKVIPKAVMDNAALTAIVDGNFSASMAQELKENLLKTLKMWHLVHHDSSRGTWVEILAEMCHRLPL